MIAAGAHGIDETATSWLIRFVASVCLLIALCYAGSTALAIWQDGWTELFADQFRQYTNLLATPFPGNALTPDNQHRQVTSNVVRLADLYWRQADQDIGVVAGLAMLLTVLTMLVVRVSRDVVQGEAFRAAAILLATIALMWAGSGRMQFHGNEAFQVYLVMACALVVIGCVESLRERPTKRAAFIAVIAGAVAMASFATGVAVVGLLIAMMVVRRVDPRWIVALAPVAVLGIVAYMFLLPGSDGVRGAVSVALLDVARNTAAFLASFWTTSWLSYADAGNAGVDAGLMATTRLGGAVVASAQAVFAVAGHPTLLGLACAIGATGLALLAWCVWRAWRDPASVGRIESLGLGLAVFGAGVAVLVSLGRSDLFAMRPSEVLADRYVPWTNMFWLGLALAVGVRFARHRIGVAGFVAGAVLIALMVYPSHHFRFSWASAMEREVERRAAQIQSSVFADGLAQFADMPDLAHAQHAINMLRIHRVGMFRAERNHLLGTIVPALPALEAPRAQTGGMAAVAEIGDAAAPAWHLEGHLLDATLRREIDGLVVADTDGGVVGIGEFSFRTDGSDWRRIDDMAAGFDVYVRSTAPCSGLHLYGVDAGATHFVALAELPGCALPPSR